MRAEIIDRLETEFRLYKRRLRKALYGLRREILEGRERGEQMTDETRRLLDKLDRNLNDILFDLVEENETLEGQVDELREQVARLAENKGEWILDETDNSVTCKTCGCSIYPNDISNGDAHFCPNCGARMKGGE